MWRGDFVLSVSRDFISRCPAPLLVLPGADSDPYHPTQTGEEIARLAPDARVVKTWKDPAHVEAATMAVRYFLRAHAAGTSRVGQL
jgi:hypothetical protein